MFCSCCQHANAADAVFCEECGTKLWQLCLGCQQPLTSKAKFCKFCGLKVAGSSSAEPAQRLVTRQAYTPQHLADKILTARSALEGERKQVTVLFCDIANSTALAERLGPEAMHTMLDWFFGLALEQVHRYEGTVNQFLGDGFMALFGAPLAHEDHARRAVLASVGLHHSLHTQQAALDHPKQTKLSLRIGLNTGPVVVGRIGDNLRMDYTAVGDTTNLAARLERLAKPGTVCISQTTYQAVRDYVVCRPLEPQMVKGKAQPVQAYRVLRAHPHAVPVTKPAGHGFASPMVGREEEIAAFTVCLEHLQGGRGGYVSVVGEAGIGKSRLMAEMRRLMTDRGIAWVEGRALSFGQTLSYWPFLQLLRSCLALTEEDDEDVCWTALERRVAELFPGQVAEVVPYLATLLGIPVRGEFEQRVKYIRAEAMRRQIFRVVRRFFEAVAREHPLVLIFEDWHWADQTSVEMLDHLLPLVVSGPLLVCVVSRSEAHMPGAGWRDLTGPQATAHSTAIALTPLSGPDSARLLQNLLGGHVLAPQVREFLLGKAEGSPFYLEEVVRVLHDMGALVQDEATGAWRTTEPVDEIPLPDTLQGVIMARIDRLGEDVKQVLKIASVIGRSFFERILRALVEAPEFLEQHLGVLRQLDLIRERRRLPELEYIFKHALVQEATYESILVERRRQLHRRVGECIETLFVDRLDDFYGVLAYHYARAEAWEKAQDYLFKAGDQADRVAADAETLTHYRQALAAYARVFDDRWEPVQRAVLERKMGEALFRRGDHHQAIEYLRRALNCLGSPYPVSRWGVRLDIAKQLAVQIGHRLLPGLFLTPLGEPASPAEKERSRIYEAMGWINYFVDQERFLLGTLRHLNAAERSGLSTGIVPGSMAFGVILDHIPLLWLSKRYYRRGMALAEHIQHPVALAFAHFGYAMHEHHALGQVDRALDHFWRAAKAYWESGDFRRWGAAIYLVAWLLRLRGDVSQSLELHQELVRLGQEAADNHVWGWGLQGWGRTLWQIGDLDEALEHLQQAIELFEAVPDYQMVACARGDVGQCYLRRGAVDEAVSVLEASRQLIAARRFRGFLCTQTRNSLAEAYLALAEHAAASARAAALKQARQACLGALKQGKLCPEGLAVAQRLQGTYEWLSGRTASASAWWQQSLAVAQRLQSQYDLGLTHLEIGKRTGDLAHLERAEVILGAIDARLDLAHIQTLISRSRVG